jgi:hypothetical protein
MYMYLYVDTGNNVYLHTEFPKQDITFIVKLT